MIRRTEIPETETSRPTVELRGPLAESRGDSRPPAAVSGFRRIGYFSGAGLCFMLGLLGAILPGLPATPFLLLTSYFLLRCSPRLNARLLRSRFLGPILTDWQIHGGVRPHVKTKAIVSVAVAVAASIVFTRQHPAIAVLIALVAVIGLAVIWKLPAARN